MASGPPQVQPALSERADIHKSCKSLETLANAFNDYCEAINFITGSQKRLVKTLRETAGLKATGEIAANTLNASASIFEVMSEINTKFGQIADKEFDNINSELKNWFKNLAKEEKAHDEKMSTVNTRIKQAGHSYETKSKKNARDVSEDHPRYPNFISTYGPEISQEKHNHALMVAYKHTLATNNVVACLSRIADTEWLRACEEVRRFASKIGQLGQWRALCEGGWTRPIPRDLPSLDEKLEQSPDPNSTRSDSYKQPVECQDYKDALTGTEQSQIDECAGVRNPQDARPLTLRTRTSSGEPFLSRKPSFASFPSAQQSKSSSPSRPNTTSNPPKVLFAPSEKWTDTVGSVASLSSFPIPPSHVPDTTGPAELGHKRSQTRPLPILVQSSGSLPSPTSARLPESPRPERTERASPENLTSSERPKSPRSPRSDLTLPPILSLASSNTQEKDTLGRGLSDITETKTQTLGNSSQNVIPKNSLSRSVTLQPVIRNWSLHTRDTSQAIEKKSSPLNSNTSSARTSGSATSKQDGEYVLDELGVRRSGGPSEPQTLIVGVERRGSTSSANSVVAAIGGRYGSPVTSSSKDTSQSSLSINELASRYQSTSPRPEVGSPIGERQPRPFGIISPHPSHSQEDHRKIDLPSPSPSTGADTEELDRRREEQEASRKQGQHSKEQVPADRQQEIEMRVREPEEGYNKSCDSSQLDDDPENLLPTTSSASEFPRMRYSYSTTQLVSPASLPPPSSFTSHPYVQSRDQASNLDHAPFCGCASCSASKYKARSTTPTPYDLRPPGSPISLRPEKPRGWIRRITVPVGHAFSLDSKKSSSVLKNGIMWSAAVGEDGRVRRSYEQGGNSNQSLMSLGRR